jgi:hypothetical protein
VVQSLAVFASAGGGTATPPAITAQPQAQTVTVGSTASFSVTATTSRGLMLNGNF